MHLLTEARRTVVSTTSLHDALPICDRGCARRSPRPPRGAPARRRRQAQPRPAARVPVPVYTAAYWAATWSAAVYTGTGTRSEEHTPELQSRGHLVCRLLLEKKEVH